VPDPAPDRPSFKVAGVVYQIPSEAEFALADGPLFVALTGFPLEDIHELAATVMMPGLLGIAVAHANPAWSRVKVCEFVQGVAFTSLEVEGGIEADDADPPEVADGDQVSRSPATSIDSTITAAV